MVQRSKSNYQTFPSAPGRNLVRLLHFARMAVAVHFLVHVHVRALLHLVPIREEETHTNLATTVPSEETAVADLVAVGVVVGLATRTAHRRARVRPSGEEIVYPPHPGGVLPATSAEDTADVVLDLLRIPFAQVALVVALHIPVLAQGPALGLILLIHDTAGVEAVPALVPSAEGEVAVATILGTAGPGHQLQKFSLLLFVYMWYFSNKNISIASRRLVICNKGSVLVIISNHV